MSLYETIRERFKYALKEQTFAKDVLRHLFSEVQSLCAKTNRPPTDDQVRDVIQKYVTANEMLLTCSPYLVNDDANQRIQRETRILKSLLPSNTTKTQLKILLSPLSTMASISNAETSGRAVGCAIKALKHLDAIYDSADLVEVVKLIRDNNNL